MGDIGRRLPAGALYPDYKSVIGAATNPDQHDDARVLS
jgi:hypothetical protein